jgi:hypothetical protein
VLLEWVHTLSGDEGAPEEGSDSTEPHVVQLLLCVSNEGMMRRVETGNEKV